MAKVNASQIRAGNVIILNDKLFAVLRAQNVQPGKGAAVTQLEMRGVKDGVKTNERFRTTEAVERAFIDEMNYQFLFQEGDMYTFMDTEDVRAGPGQRRHHRRSEDLPAGGHGGPHVAVRRRSGRRAAAADRHP